jgi:hypothetical protein
MKLSIQGAVLSDDVPSRLVAGPSQTINYYFSLKGWKV